VLASPGSGADLKLSPGDKLLICSTESGRDMGG